MERVHTLTDSDRRSHKVDAPKVLREHDGLPYTRPFMFGPLGASEPLTTAPAMLGNTVSTREMSRGICKHRRGGHDKFESARERAEHEGPRAGQTVGSRKKCVLVTRAQKYRKVWFFEVVLGDSCAVGFLWTLGEEVADWSESASRRETLPAIANGRSEHTPGLFAPFAQNPPRGLERGHFGKVLTFPEARRLPRVSTRCVQWAC